MFEKRSKSSLVMGALALATLAAGAVASRVSRMAARHTQDVDERHAKTLSRTGAVLAAALCSIVVVAIAGWVYWSAQQRTQRVAQAMTGGEISRAPAHFRRYGCAGCHTIPGISSADGQVGGRLEDMRRRVYIGGAALNTPEAIIRWIVRPQTFAPHSAMPASGITEAEARDVAAYLYAY